MSLTLRMPNGQDTPEYHAAYQMVKTLENEWQQNQVQVETLLERVKEIQTDTKVIQSSLQQQLETAKQAACESERESSFFAGVVRMAMDVPTSHVGGIVNGNKAKAMKKSTLFNGFPLKENDLKNLKHSKHSKDIWNVNSTQNNDWTMLMH